MKKNLITLLLITMSCTMFSQKLLNPSVSFTKKKITYVTLLDGTEISGKLKDLDRDKGLIEKIKIKDANGKKHKLKAEEIKFMYLPQSKLDKLSKITDNVLDVQKWGDKSLDQEKLKSGYIYFELSDVKIKKKTKKMLMQLLNPSFSSKIKVYHNPRAKKSMSIGLGSLKLAGGNLKSYYIAKGDEVAFRLRKKDYDEEFDTLWGSCPDLIKEFSEKKWSNLTKHIIKYSECTK